MSSLGSVITDDWSVVSGPECSDVESFIFVPNLYAGSTTSEVHITQITSENATCLHPDASQAISKSFLYPSIQRKSRFRYTPRLHVVPENTPVTLTLAECSTVETEIYDSDKNKAQLMANIATLRFFRVSLPIGKIDLRVFSFLKTKLVTRLMDELLPADSARFLWTEYSPIARGKWLQDKEIEIHIRRRLLVDEYIPNRYLANLPDQSHWEALREAPYKRAMKFGPIVYANKEEEFEESEEKSWSCHFCTFLNFFETTKCEMCGNAPYTL